MCSSRRTNPWREWSLRTRLLVGQVVVLAVVIIGIGVVTELALHQYLVGQLDVQLHNVSRRSAGMFSDPLPPPPWVQRRPASLPPVSGPVFLDAPGQPIGIVAAVVDGGATVDSGFLTAQGARGTLTDTANAQLGALAPNRRPLTQRIDGLGRYRLVAVRAPRGGEIIVVGLPMTHVDDTMLRVSMIFGVVTLGALGAAIMAGVVIIRRALAPLTRVAQAAGEVATLPLDRGEVALPVRVPQPDANPATEVGRLGSVVNRMLDHITAALATRQASETRVRQFVADASHELRTPLAAISGYTELAQRMGDDPDAVAHALARVGSETERMTHLVEDLLLLARLDSGRPLEREPVDLSRLVADAVSDAHVAGPDHEWKLDLAPKAVLVTGDAARLHQVVANLLANARVHSGPGSMVTTKLTAEPAHAVLTVSDDGPGMSEALQEAVFERFTRGSGSRSRKDGGTGLGLAIVSAVVKAHDGTITVQSAPGHTEFEVRLPLDGSAADLRR